MTEPLRWRWTALLGLAASCASPRPMDYSALIAHMPRSILVLPPLDETAEGNGSWEIMPYLTEPLAERGYYVFPIAMVDRMMRENGLPTPHEMHEVSLSKLAEVFDPDAVLYLTVHEWGTSYEVLRSATEVSMSGHLVDVDSGALLWSGGAVAQDSSGSGGHGLLGMLTNAIVNQIASSVSDPSPRLAREVSWRLLGGHRRGLLLGPLHPEHEKSVLAATPK